ncbi:MAG: hypothetical protein K6F50_09120 [Kiritimatiellae bacterium]|nr:hypothetical protein [Kiritimatiellia bacterium]
MTNTTLMIVMSALAAGQPEWKGVADALEAKHANEAKISRVTYDGNVTNLLADLREKSPRYVAFVMQPEEVRFKTTLAIKRMMRDIDEDPFEDAIWGIVTGPTAKDALRIAKSRGPARLETALSTTGVGDGIVPGALVCFSDAYPKGEWRTKSADGKTEKHSSKGDISDEFRKAWNSLDPDFILTSSHASQRNLEMPFSRGNIVPVDGRFETMPKQTLIDYATGMAKAGPRKSSGTPLDAPKREKVWLAAGNCLIADNLGKPGENMVMTALGFGKVNQFVGYEATTWFGDIGWNTWAYFGTQRLPLVESHWTAKQWLLKRIGEWVSNAGDFRPKCTDAASYDRILVDLQRFPFKGIKPITNQQDAQKFAGMLWDRDATVFYGDPMTDVSLAKNEGKVAASGKDPLPRPVIFPSKAERKFAPPSPEWKAFVADDFALLLAWPEHDAAEEAALFPNVH